MKIHFLTSSVKPMYEWLVERKSTNTKNLSRLKEILSNDDYHIEFLRYGIKNLPVSTISFDEAIDFFMNFDEKHFANPRLEYKRPYFVKFYNDLENKIELISTFASFTKTDEETIDNLLLNGLPDYMSNEKQNFFNILFIISIGNSMGRPYENYLDFDVANLDLIKDKTNFLHLIAHEIHHTRFSLLIKNNMNLMESFLVNFAFEGLAMHFNNNASTLFKEKKYPNEPSYEIDEFSWSLFENDFDDLFSMFKKDLYESKTYTSDEELSTLVESHYEKFTYTSFKDKKEYKISQYPTYYLGTYLWGIIDNAFGKEILFETLKNPEKFVNVYNQAVLKIGNKKYLL